MARATNGDIIDNKKAIEADIENENNKKVIGALVIGSKSGIEDDISVIPDVSDEVLWTVDLCQLRNSKKLVNDLLDKGCLVMITGSKFYMSPPFCGALLIPKKFSADLNKVNVEKVKHFTDGFKKVFSKYDFPNDWKNIRSLFNDNHNDGLVVRWEAALELMERFDDLPMDVSKKIIFDWNNVVRTKIRGSKHFVLMPQQDKTNQTIVSFKVKHSNGEFLDYTQLKEFHQKITYNPFVFEKFKNVIIGQPVKYSNGAFLRLSLIHI